jgi:hypothetical protein
MHVITLKFFGFRLILDNERTNYTFAKWNKQNNERTLNLWYQVCMYLANSPISSNLWKRLDSIL